MYVNYVWRKQIVSAPASKSKMVKCSICNKSGATAWLKKKSICQNCWVVYKYGDMESYSKRIKEKKKKKDKKKFIKELKGGKNT